MVTLFVTIQLLPPVALPGAKLLPDLKEWV